MPDNDLSADFFSWLDQVACSPEGVLVQEGHETRVRPALNVYAEWRSLRGSRPQPAPARPSRFPEVERRRHQLALMAYQLEKEARDEP
jgi:hypothetical protein